MPRAPQKRYRARTDGRPHRSWSSLNIRRGDKLRLDIVIAWESMKAGRELSQWDVFSMLLESHLKGSEGRIPADVLAQLADAEIDARAEFVVGVDLTTHDPQNGFSG